MQKEAILKHIKHNPFLTLKEKYGLQDEHSLNSFDLVYEKYDNYYISCFRLLHSLEEKEKNYLIFDLSTFILHLRILLDYSTKISKFFLKKGEIIPSPNSFNSHLLCIRKNKLWKLSDYKDYYSLMNNNTGWFSSFKNIRDEAIVHPFTDGHIRIIRKRNHGHYYWIVPLKDKKPKADIPIEELMWKISIFLSLFVSVSEKYLEKNYNKINQHPMQSL